MLNNDLRRRMPSANVYDVVAALSQSPFAAKRWPSSSVIITDNGRRARLRSRLQGVFYVRPVNSRGTRRTESRTFEIRSSRRG